VRSGWNVVERRLVDAIRWWTVDEIAAASEPVYPAGLAGLLPDLIAGRLPDAPLWLGGEGAADDPPPAAPVFPLQGDRGR
jgi:hypothetical protein